MIRTMIRLSIILSVVHFALAYGLRCGFSRTAEWDSEFAARCSDFACRIEFALTQPGRWLCGLFSWEDGSAGFWALMVLTSILWGNILAFLIRRAVSLLFR